MIGNQVSRFQSSILLFLALVASACGHVGYMEDEMLSEKSHPDHDKRFDLWMGPAPEALGQGDGHIPYFTAHLPPLGQGNGAAVIVNPGGGYHVLAADHEGLQVARWWSRHGVAAFVLRYRLKPNYQPDVSLRDGQRMVRFVRAHAARFAIDPNRIGMMGFSAGGNLASAVGTAFDSGQATADDAVERQSSRPDFLGLIYPAISHAVGNDRYGPSTEELVTAQTPPAFLVHTHEDNLTPLHSLRFYEALLKHHTPAELHVFSMGPHGTGLGSGDPDLGQWPRLMLNWMARQGFLSDQPRVAIEGQIELRGEAFYWGWLSMIPEDERLPSVAVYIGREQKGVFKVDRTHGPSVGRYRVELVELSNAAMDMKIGKTSMADQVIHREPANGGGPLRVEIRQDTKGFHWRFDGKTSPSAGVKTD